MNLKVIEMLDFHATPTEFKKGGGVDKATNIASLRDWVDRLMGVLQSVFPISKIS